MIEEPSNHKTDQNGDATAVNSIICNNSHVGF